MPFALVHSFPTLRTSPCFTFPLLLLLYTSKNTDILLRRIKYYWTNDAISNRLFHLPTDFIKFSTPDVADLSYGSLTVSCVLSCVVA